MTNPVRSDRAGRAASVYCGRYRHGNNDAAVNSCNTRKKYLNIFAHPSSIDYPLGIEK